MKTFFATFLFATLFLGAPSVFAADDIEQVIGEVDQLQNTIAEKTPESLKGTFQKIEAWRVAKAADFTIKRDEQDALLHPEGEEKTVTLNEEGNIEIETGIGEAKEQPKVAAMFYLYLILVFIFSSVYLFYAVLVLLVLSILKVLLGALTHKKE
jgi:hypothetical protein